MMEVVGGVLVRNNKILLPKRSYMLSKYPGFYEFPGGKVEKGETLKFALKRELFEELSIDVDEQDILEFEENNLKTKDMNLIIQKLEITHSLIILDKASKEKVEKSARNIPNVKVTDVNHFSSYDIIKFKKVVFTESSVKELEKRYS